MEKYSGMIDTVLLLDNYGEESQMLPNHNHRSRSPP